MHRRLLLLRHAKSAWDGAGAADFDRPLAPRGRRAAALIGAYIRDEGLTPDLVLCSAARRAAETWEIAARNLDRPVPVRHVRELYMAPVATFYRTLAALDDTAVTVLCLGHETSIDAFGRNLVGFGPAAVRRRFEAKMPTAALAVIALDAPAWQDARQGVGTLVSFVAPKELV
jgi:phosphohistidine phosphatase